MFGCRLYMLLKFNVTAAAVDSRLRLGKRTFFRNPQSATGISGRSSEEPHREKKQGKDFGISFGCSADVTQHYASPKLQATKYVM